MALFRAHLLLGGHHGPDARGGEALSAGGQELEGRDEEHYQEPQGLWRGGGKMRRVEEGRREGGRRKGGREGGMEVEGREGWKEKI